MLWFEYKKETNIFFWTGILTIQENYFRIQD